MSENPSIPVHTPSSVDSQIQRALQSAGAGQRNQAIAILRAALAAQPAHIAARCLLGAMLHENGDSVAALQVLDDAPAAGHAALQETRASILIALGRAGELPHCLPWPAGTTRREAMARPSWRASTRAR